jgi:hypothetical protein
MSTFVSISLVLGDVLFPVGFIRQRGSERKKCMKNLR